MTADSPASGLPQEAVEHELKTVQPWFDALVAGTKTFEFRRFDRSFIEGDTLVLREWDGERFTGREVRRRVGSMVEVNGSVPKLNDGVRHATYVVMSLMPLAAEPAIVNNVCNDPEASYLKADAETCRNCGKPARNCADEFAVLCCQRCTHPGGPLVTCGHLSVTPPQQPCERESGHTGAHQALDGRIAWSGGQADDPATPTPATTCADCGTTRTICDAGLNTYDTRCCGQCGHGAA